MEKQECVKMCFAYMNCQLRLAIALIIFSDPHLMALIATQCSSFVHINTGTSKRSEVCPDGDTNMPSVVLGNALAARSCLIILILTLLRRTFILEQPGSSLLMKTTWMQWLIEVLAEQNIRVFRQPFWMSAFGHKRPKRTLLWSCSPIISLFRTDKIAKVSKEPAVVKKYVKNDGSMGYTGVGKRLKETEQLAHN